jgi:peptidoglycan hydrolase-like protein with peptidoglycan-binding domain
VARLRLKGFPVYEFGERVMQEGSFGDDVMQLQAYLSEQGYFSSEDGLSGYFGSVTGDALQAWQGDHGLRVTGVFDADSKWTYLKQQVCTAGLSCGAGPLLLG